jgi:hypothetical protein
MARYVSVSEQQVRVGQTALLLFVREAKLCAGLIERRPDGRVVRHKPDEHNPVQIVSVISTLMEGQGLDADLMVVLEEGAYWPDAFPALADETVN